MTPRERVLAAFRFERPDRVPRRDIFEGPFVERWRDGGVVIGPHFVSPDIPIANYETYYHAVDGGGD